MPSHEHDEPRPADGVPSVQELLRGSPRNWGRWGAHDELGALNLLTSAEVLEGVAQVRQGKVHTLGLPLMHPDGDPTWPGRRSPQHLFVSDKGRFLAGKGTELAGGMQYADDLAIASLHGTTHYDALGHAWAGDELYNGFDAQTTAGGLSQASVLPLAAHGIVGRAVLLDVARWRDKEALDPAETFDHADLLACAEAQETEIRPRDVLLIRTGWIARFYREGAEALYADLREPGLTHSAELVEWFRSMDVPNIVTDTFGNEVTVDPASGVYQPLHIALMSYLGILFTELAWLEELAADCAADRQFTFLYVAGPLKVHGGTAGPVNPIAVK